MVANARTNLKEPLKLEGEGKKKADAMMQSLGGATASSTLKDSVIQSPPPTPPSLSAAQKASITKVEGHRR